MGSKSFRRNPISHHAAMRGGNVVQGIQSPLDLDNLTLFARFDKVDTSALWQDFLRTLHPAALNDPVRVLDDLSPAGNHLLVPGTTQFFDFETISDGLFADPTRPSIFKPEAAPTVSFDKDGSSAFSLWTVVLTRTAPVTYDYVTKRNVADSGAGYALLQRTGQGIRFLIEDGAAGVLEVQGPVLAGNTPYIVLATYDGSKTAAGVNMYVNGSSVALSTITDTLVGSSSNAEPFNVHGQGDGVPNASPFGSFFREVGFTNDVITPSEHSEIYTKYWSPTYGV